MRAIDALALLGVKTHVIGIDAQLDAALARQLTEYAKHGGSDDFYAVQSNSGLEPKLTELTADAADCAYALGQTLPAEASAHIEVDGIGIARDPQQGWSTSGSQLRFAGAACARLRDMASTHKVTLRGGCTP